MPTQDFKGTINGVVPDQIVGDGTAGRVLRSFNLLLQPGGTPNTNINVTANGTAGISFNTPTIANATNLAASETSGSFTLSADGKSLTMDVTPAFIGVLGVSILVQKINSAGTLPYWFIAQISSGNLVLQVYAQGSSAASDFRAILDASDYVLLMISALTAA